MWELLKILLMIFGMFAQLLVSISEVLEEEPLLLVLLLLSRAVKDRLDKICKEVRRVEDSMSTLERRRTELENRTEEFHAEQVRRSYQGDINW